MTTNSSIDIVCGHKFIKDGQWTDKLENFEGMKTGTRNGLVKYKMAAAPTYIRGKVLFGRKRQMLGDICFDGTTAFKYQLTSSSGNSVTSYFVAVAFLQGHGL